MASKPAFAPNAQIEHPKFGCGTVLSCDTDYVVIRFDDYGEKKFIASIVLSNLTRIDREPPPEKKRSRTRRTAKKKKVAKAAK